MIHGLQLIHELCVDPVTCGPMLELLGGEKYDTNLKVCHHLPSIHEHINLLVTWVAFNVISV